MVIRVLLNVEKMNFRFYCENIIFGEPKKGTKGEKNLNLATRVSLKENQKKIR